MVGWWASNPTVTPPLPRETLQICLSERPTESISSETFVQQRAPLPDLAKLPSDNVIVRVLYLSCDPAMRIWLNPTRSYMPPVEVGAVMRSAGVGEVVRAAGGFRQGELVEGMVGWTEYAVLPAKKLMRVRVPRGLAPSVWLGVLGITGMTAYFGLLEVGKVQKGDCVVVSAAAGATGSVVAQIAKNVYGCKTIGIAGGPEKCRYLEEELGIIAVDYKAEQGVNEGLKKALGDSRIDIYFDNVGGTTLEAALRRINSGARVVICGAISGYNKKTVQPGPHNYMNLLTYSASMTGFLLRDYENKYSVARTQLSKWVVAGKIKFREDVVVGLENAPKALIRLFEGKNIGKVVVRVATQGSSTQKIVAKL